MNLLANVMTDSSCCFWKCTEIQAQIFRMICLNFCACCYILMYTHCWKLTKAVGSQGSSWLLFPMKVMVWHLVSDSHKAMSVLIAMLPFIFLLWRVVCNFRHMCSPTGSHQALFVNREGYWLFLFDISLPSKCLFHLGRSLWCPLIMMWILIINIWALGMGFRLA